MLQSAQDVPRSDNSVFTWKTYVVSEDQTTVVADSLEDLLDLDDKS